MHNQRFHDKINIIFFFQAEDGIRDRSVTGVQTCALPIWRGRSIVASHRGPSQRAVAHELDDVDGDAEPAHGIEILAEAVPADTRLAADAPDPVAHLVFTSLPDGAGREAAHPD